MKLYASLVIVPLLLVTTACSSHYSASSHAHARGHNSHHDRHSHSRHHSSHVSIGVNSHHRGGKLLGALIVGGLIGHAITEASHDHDEHHSAHNSKQLQGSNETDELVNGYKVKSEVKAEKQAEQNRYYELGDDGNCYLMQKKNSSSDIIAAVPSYSCQ
jgi:hypothetical protein